MLKNLFFSPTFCPKACIPDGNRVLYYYKEIQNYIIHDLKRGATLYVAQGAYDEKHRTELVTILAQQEYRLLLNYLHTTKKDVFVTVSTVNEVIGQWNAK